jgi:hypothetical protein
MVIVIYFENFLRVLEIKTLLTIFCCLFVKIIQMKFLLPLSNHLLIVKILPVTRFWKLAPAFPWPSVTVKVLKQPVILKLF